MNMLFVDHGIFRLIYLNKHQVTPEFYRLAQPTPWDIRALVRSGCQTLVTLRGGREYGSWSLEKEACAAEGLVLEEVTVRSRAAPDREMLLKSKDFFASLAYPVAVHCKAGADRAGFMSALYLLVHKNRSVAEAKEQLSLLYGHFRFSKTGILDDFFDGYEECRQKTGIDFFTWVRDVYNPEALEKAHRTRFITHIFVDYILHRE
jgi:protein tyrosine/serine phosphatase